MTRKVGFRHGKFHEFDNVGGIYKIKNTVTGNCYVGKSTNLRERFRIHRAKMKKGYKEVPVLAEDIRLHGIESFEYEVLEVVDWKDEKSLSIAEKKWFKIIKPQYNKWQKSLGRSNHDSDEKDW